MNNDALAWIHEYMNICVCVCTTFSRPMDGIVVHLFTQEALRTSDFSIFSLFKTFFFAYVLGVY